MATSASQLGSCRPVSQLDTVTLLNAFGRPISLLTWRPNSWSGMFPRRVLRAVRMRPPSALRISPATAASSLRGRKPGLRFRVYRLTSLHPAGQSPPFGARPASFDGVIRTPTYQLDRNLGRLHFGGQLEALVHHRPQQRMERQAALGEALRRRQRSPGLEPAASPHEEVGRLLQAAAQAALEGRGNHLPNRV